MAKARKTDPATSHEAADSVVFVTETQDSVYRLLSKRMTDFELVDVYRKQMRLGKVPFASESGIRSRRSELVALGLVEAKGEDKSLFGRRCLVWGRV